jgi:hypothetical protein
MKIKIEIIAAGTFRLPSLGVAPPSSAREGVTYPIQINKNSTKTRPINYWSNLNALSALQYLCHFTKPFVVRTLGH